MRDNERQWSWLQLFAGALATADQLSKQGLDPGDHVALRCDNRAEYYSVALGGLLAGVWITPINIHLTPPEIEYVLADSGARLLVSDTPPASSGGPPWSPLEALLACADDFGSEAVLDGIEQRLSLPAGGFLMYTSGTTGRPKGVKRHAPTSVGEALTSWAALGHSIGLDGDGPHLVTGPLYHAAPGLYALYDLLNGATLIIMPRWESEQALSLIERHGVRHTHLVPTMFVRLLRQRHGLSRDYDLSSLSLVLHGAAPIAAGVKSEVIDWWGPILVEYWGGSESGIITRVDSAAWLAHPGTVGRPLPQYEVTVRDDAFNPVPVGTVGNLYARRQGVARPFEYFGDADKTRDSYVQEWFTLGDLGRVDEAGYVYLADRRSNLIISGGVNIYPAEIESVLLEHPAVADVAVIGVDDEEWGKRVEAIVAPVQGDFCPEQLEQELADYVGQRLAKFKAPRRYEFVEQLPRFDSGKLYLNRLKRV